MRAIEHVRRMPGGSQPQLMRCREATGSDAYYVVKFLQNPQHRRVLANEWVAAWLASKLGLPVPPSAIVDVPADLIEASESMMFQLPHGRSSPRSGPHFGSRYPGIPGATKVYDFLPEELPDGVENASDFLGMLVFDKWTCNTDNRQVIFYRPQTGSKFRALMIDHGSCFNGREWDFPDSPGRGLYLSGCVYGPVTGLKSFEPWIQRVEDYRLEHEIEEIISKTPPEWYDSDRGAISQLLKNLCRRRQDLGRLIAAAKGTRWRPFPNWT